MTVLVPIDGSDASDRALSYAIDFAEDRDLPVHAVHVTDYRTEATETLLDRARDRLGAASVDADLDVLYRDGTYRASSKAGKRILELLDDGDYDHVVMGHHDLGTTSRAVLGSCARTVIDGASVPVTVIP